MAPTDDEIQDQIEKAEEGKAEGSKVPGMSYEDGVSAALRWASGESDEKPMED